MEDDQVGSGGRPYQVIVDNYTLLAFYYIIGGGERNVLMNIRTFDEAPLSKKKD